MRCPSRFAGSAEGGRSPVWPDKGHLQPPTAPLVGVGAAGLEDPGGVAERVAGGAGAAGAAEPVGVEELGAGEFEGGATSAMQANSGQEVVFGGGVGGE